MDSRRRRSVCFVLHECRTKQPMRKNFISRYSLKRMLTFPYLTQPFQIKQVQTYQSFEKLACTWGVPTFKNNHKEKIKIKNLTLLIYLLYTANLSNNITEHALFSRQRLK